MGPPHLPAFGNLSGDCSIWVALQKYGKTHQIINFNKVFHYKPSILGENTLFLVDTHIFDVRWEDFSEKGTLAAQRGEKHWLR